MQYITKHGAKKRLGNHRKEPYYFEKDLPDGALPRSGHFRDPLVGNLYYRLRSGTIELCSMPYHLSPHTKAQKKNEQDFPNISRSYSILKSVIPLVWERPKIKPPKLDSDFISQNIEHLRTQNAAVVLTSLQNKLKACALSPLQLSKGTMASISVTNNISSIHLPINFSIDENTTVGEFSAALIASDKRAWREGDNLHYISLRQHDWQQEGEYIPKLTVVSGKVTLNLWDNTPIYSVFPPEGLAVTNNRLAHRTPDFSDPVGVPTKYGYCWIKTRIVHNNLHASTQYLNIVYG